MTQQPSAPSVSSHGPETTQGLRTFRRIAIILIIASLSITALVGIATLVGGSYGELQGKIMLTTLIIGATSVVALCDLAVFGRGVRYVGIVGLLTAAVAMVTALILIQGTGAPEYVVKIFALSSIAAVSIAHASLLLLLSERRRMVVRTGLWITVALIGLLLVLLYIAILSDGHVWSEAFTKLVGTVAILDVLGTVVVPVISVFLKDDGVQQIQAALTVTMPPALAERLSRVAEECGTTAERFAVDAITHSLDAIESAEPSTSQ